jgi:hypothetical protein
MCGKASLFRLVFVHFKAAVRRRFIFKKDQRRSRGKIYNRLSEKQSFSAHQAAKPQNQHKYREPPRRGSRATPPL